MKAFWILLGALTLSATAPAWAADTDDAMGGPEEDIGAAPARWDEPGEGKGRMGHGRRGPGGRHHDLLMRGLNELDLSGEQRERLADIRDRQERRGIAAHAEIRGAALDLRKLMREERPNRQAIETQIDRLAQMRAELQKSHVAARLDAREVLTTKQREELRNLGPEHRVREGRRERDGRPTPPRGRDSQ